MRLCTTQDGTQWFGRSNVTAIILLIWFIGCVASGMQYVYDVSFDYCNRKNNKQLLPLETGGWINSLMMKLNIEWPYILRPMRRRHRNAHPTPTLHHVSRSHPNHNWCEKIHESAEFQAKCGLQIRFLISPKQFLQFPDICALLAAICHRFCHLLLNITTTHHRQNVLLHGLAWTIESLFP